MSTTTLHCGMCACYGETTVTRSSREWLDQTGANGRWVPICRACYRELRAAYASGAQGPAEATTRVERLEALRQVTR